MAQTSKFPPVDILKWQVNRRADVQRLMVDLYDFLLRSRSTILANNELNRAFHLLVASSFSLWRAVFLTHADRKPIAVLQHCEDFLGTVIRDNAINFPQDRETREWTVGYYLNNANLRLQALSRLNLLQPNGPLQEFASSATDGIIWTDPIARWDEMFELLVSSLKILESTTNTSGE